MIKPIHENYSIFLKSISIYKTMPYLHELPPRDKISEK